jgi:hypothetical protein
VVVSACCLLPAACYQWQWMFWAQLLGTCWEAKREPT